MQNMAAYNFTMGGAGTGLVNPQRNVWRQRTSPVTPMQIVNNMQPLSPIQRSMVEPARCQHEGGYIKPEPYSLDQACKNLIVNYLPQTFKDKNLFDLFVPYGPLHSVKIMREPQNGYSYGFGFVNFIKVEDAAKAVQAMNGRQVGANKRLKVSFARPPSDDIKDTNLYITNLPKSTQESDLVEMFGKFGTIVQKNLLYDKLTGLMKGTAFVRFAHRDEAAQAIFCMNDYLLPGCWEPIHVKLAQDHGKQKAYIAGYQDALRRAGGSGSHSRSRGSTSTAYGK